VRTVATTLVGVSRETNARRIEGAVRSIESDATRARKGRLDRTVIIRSCPCDSTLSFFRGSEKSGCPTPPREETVPNKAVKREPPDIGSLRWSPSTTRLKQLIGRPSSTGAANRGVVLESLGNQGQPSPDLGSTAPPSSSARRPSGRHRPSSRPPSCVGPCEAEVHQLCPAVRNTSPMPPTPSGAAISHGPSRAPGARVTSVGKLHLLQEPTPARIVCGGRCTRCILPSWSPTS
jgi:hypothetical protein